MAEILDRIKASTCRARHLINDKEASAVLALNDGAANYGKGRFYYLPESEEPPTIRRNRREPVVTESVVPRLLYVDHEWTEGERKDYWHKTEDEEREDEEREDEERYQWIQEQTTVELRAVDVIPINLAIQTSSITSLSWPAKSLAVVTIYGPGPWYRLSWMSDWIEKATVNEAKDTCTVSMYQTGHLGQRRARYSQSVNAIGHICGADDIPSVLRAMLRLSVDESKVTEGVSPEATAEWQLSENESRECTWIAGADISNVLKLEAENGGGQGALSTTERVEIDLDSE